LTSQRMTRAEMIRWLGNAISTETEKPFEEIDYDFVEECGQLLDELMGKSAAMSEKEIADRMEKLKPGTISSVRKKTGCRKLWKIAVAAAVVLCMGVTVIAVPAWRHAVLTVLQLDVGESIVEDGITYTHGGKTTQYDDIDALIAAENLDILSFKDPDGKLRIQEIKHIDESSTTTFIFNETSINFEIQHNANYLADSIINTSSKESCANFDAYVFPKEISGTILYNAYIYYNNSTYLISTSSETTLYSIIQSLTVGD